MATTSSQSAFPTTTTTTTKNASIAIIVGNIGVGKSSLISNIESDYGKTVPVVFEPVREWQQIGLLEDLYASFVHPDEFYRSSVAYMFQNFAFSSRMASLKKAITERDASSSLVVSDGHVLIDRYVFGQHLHSSGGMLDKHWCMYLATFQHWRDIVPEAVPTVIIYLKASPQTCLERIGERQRPEEQAIPLTYLQALNDRFEAFIGDEDAVANSQIVTVDTEGQSADQVYMLVKPHLTRLQQ